MNIKYPVRCEIIDVTGEKMGELPIKTPIGSFPYIGKRGLAEKINGEVRITLDNGDIIYGYECWWTPLNDEH